MLHYFLNIAELIGELSLLSIPSRLSQILSLSESIEYLRREI